MWQKSHSASFLRPVCLGTHRTLTTCPFSTDQTAALCQLCCKGVRIFQGACSSISFEGALQRIFIWADAGRPGRPAFWPSQVCCRPHCVQDEQYFWLFNFSASAPCSNKVGPRPNPCSGPRIRLSVCTVSDCPSVIFWNLGTQVLANSVGRGEVSGPLWQVQAHTWMFHFSCVRVEPSLPWPTSLLGFVRTAKWKNKVPPFQIPPCPTSFSISASTTHGGHRHNMQQHHTTTSRTQNHTSRLSCTETTQQPYTTRRDNAWQHHATYDKHHSSQHETTPPHPIPPLSRLVHVYLVFVHGAMSFHTKSTARLKPKSSLVSDISARMSHVPSCRIPSQGVRDGGNDGAHTPSDIALAVALRTMSYVFILSPQFPKCKLHCHHTMQHPSSSKQCRHTVCLWRVLSKVQSWSDPI